MYWVPVRNAGTNYSDFEAADELVWRAVERREKRSAGEDLGTKTERVRGGAAANTRRSAEPRGRH